MSLCQKVLPKVQIAAKTPPRKQITFLYKIVLVLPVLLLLAANLSWQNGKAFVAKYTKSVGRRFDPSP